MPDCLLTAAERSGPKRNPAHEPIVVAASPRYVISPFNVQMLSADVSALRTLPAPAHCQSRISGMSSP